MKKLEKALTAEEYNAAMIGSSREERMQRLDEAFRQLAEDEYARVIKRLKLSWLVICGIVVWKLKRRCVEAVER